MTDILQRLEQGALARLGLLGHSQMRAAGELLKQLEAGDSRHKIETVRVLFADQHGILRGKSIVASAFASVFENGITVPSTLLLKDSSHRTVFPVWNEPGQSDFDLLRGAGDILLLPDASTFRVLPWSPHSAWILCDVVFATGEPLPFASRTVLKNALSLLDARSLSMQVGLELEFHVYACLDPKLSHADAGMPAQAPLTANLAQGYQLLTETRYAELESVMDELRRNCEAMGLPLRSMEVEFGPGQFEFTFAHGEMLAQADNMVLFRTLVKEVCARRSLHATFMCRPRIENGAASGWHLHQSLNDAASGANLFMPETDDQLTPAASQWIAGLLSHARESCVLSTPTINGYKRYQPYQLAPDRIQWGRDNRGAMIRGLLRPGDTGSRIENRVAEPAANPYYFFSSQIISGLAGIEQKMQAPAAVESPYHSDAAVLPDSLLSAVDAFEGSTLYRSTLGDQFVDYLCRIKRAEWERYIRTVSEWEHNEYFSLF